MKYILILIIQFFCLMAPIQPTHNLLKTLPSYSQTVLLTEKQGLQSKNLNLPPRLSIFWKFFPKFFHWNHFMELECFKDICTQTNFRDYSDKIRQKEMSSFLRNNQKQNFQKIKETRYQTMREYPGKERIIFWAPETVSLMKKQSNQKLDKQNVISTTESQLDINNYKNSFDIRIISTKKDRKEEVENSEVHPDKYHHQKTIPENNILVNFFKKPNLVEQSTENTRNNFLPYEVEEIIEEKYETEVNDESNESLFKEKETMTVDSDKKNHNYSNIMNSSINSILNKLLSSTKQKELFKGKNDFNTLLPSKETDKWTLSTRTDLMRTSTEGRYKNEKNVFSNTFNKTPRPTPQQKQIFGNWRQKSSEKTQIVGRNFLRPEMSTRMNNSRRIDFIPFSENILSSDSPQINILSTSSVIPDYDLVRTEDYEIPSTVNSNRNHLFTTNTQTLRDFTTGNGSKETTEAEKLITGKPLDSTQQIFFTPFPNNIFATNISTKHTTVHQIMQTEAEILLAPKDSQETIENVSETYINYEEITKEYTEFTDRPMSFDLLPTTVKSEIKKEIEGSSKNSRKMHFENSQEPTVSNEIYDVETEQRRSDILIADSIADYIDEENNLPYVSYIENLKHNNSFFPHESKNLTSDALIPLISRVINDLREGKIPSEDFSILSEALGKYWKPILTLSNMTNLDMLPLLKMKTEKEFESFLQNFLPEETTTSKTTENKGKPDEYYGELYDYMNMDYKDLYKDVLGENVDMKKRRLRPKRDTDADTDAETDADTDYLQALEARREYFESLEEEQNNEESHYIFEDIIYDEMLDDSYSMLDLKKITNVQIDPET